MARKSKPLPTESELRILEVLWELGSGTVREVHETLSRSRTTGHTTVLKLMQIMTEKGLVTVDRSTRPQTYTATEPQARTQRHLVGDLLDRAFSGEPGPLVLQALSAKRATPEELRQIRELLDRMEEEGTE